MFGVPPQDVPMKQGQRGSSPISGGEDGTTRGSRGQSEEGSSRGRSSLQREKVTEQLSSFSPATLLRATLGTPPLGRDSRNSQDHPRMEPSANWPSTDVDIKPSQQPARFHSTSTLMNQALGTALGDSGRKQVLESLRAVDLSSSRSSGPSLFPAKERSFHAKGPESPSALGLSGVLSSFSSQTQSATVREASSGTRATRTGDLDNWDSMGSERLGNTGKEISSRQSQQPEKQKLPPSFLQALSLSQREKHPAESKDHQALPLLPSPGLPNLPGQSSNGVFSRKSFVPHIQAEGFSMKGTESRSNISSTYSELDKRRLRMGMGMSKTTGLSSANEASQSLPHWLREAFKPDQPAPPKAATVSPMIAAVAQATSFLYKDCVPFLPPFIHPGPLPTPPKRFPKKRKEQKIAESRVSTDIKVARCIDSSGPRNVANLLMSGLEPRNQDSSLPSSLEQFASSLKAGFGGGGQAAPSSTSSFARGLFDFSGLPSMEPPAQNPPFSKPSALAELMALKNLSAVPTFAPPLNESLRTGSDKSPFAQSGSSVMDLDSAGPNLALGNGEQHGSRQGHQRGPSLSSVSKQLRQPHLKPNNDSGEGHVSHLKLGREALLQRQTERLSFTFPQPGSEVSIERPQIVRYEGGQQKLPEWLFSPAEAAPRTREAPTNRSVTKWEGGNSSSETESDPRIRGKAGAAHDLDDVSSDETISDDRTQ